MRRRLASFPRKHARHVCLTTPFHPLPWQELEVCFFAKRFERQVRVSRSLAYIETRLRELETQTIYGPDLRLGETRLKIWSVLGATAGDALGAHREISARN